MTPPSSILRNHTRMAASPCDLAHNRFYAQRTTPPCRREFQHYQGIATPFDHRRPSPSRRGDSCLLDGGMTDVEVMPMDTRTAPQGSAMPTPRRTLIGMLGPAFVAAVAYVDPGNVAANITREPGTAICWCGCWPLANMMSVLIHTSPPNSASSPANRCRSCSESGWATRGDSCSSPRPRSSPSPQIWPS